MEEGIDDPGTTLPVGALLVNLQSQAQQPSPYGHLYKRYPKLGTTTRTYLKKVSKQFTENMRHHSSSS